MQVIQIRAISALNDLDIEGGIGDLPDSCWALGSVTQTQSRQTYQEHLRRPRKEKPIERTGAYK